jgi:predicted ATPase
MNKLLELSGVDTLPALFDNPVHLKIASNLAISDPVLLQGIAEFKAQSEWLRVAEHERMSPFSSQFHYIFSERFGPRKMLPLSESHVREKNMGLNGEYVLHFLLEYGKKISLGEGDPRLLNVDEFGRSVEGQVDAWLQEISPGSHLSTEPIQRADSVLTGFAFDRLGDVKTRAFRATNVGFGLSYVLPVLVALLSSEKGALILLENPEAHMHPRGQTRLGQLAARTAAAGIQVIVETHSDHVMDGVRIDIREGGAHRLAAHDAVFHYFERDESGVKVATPKITDDGRLDDWPSGFFDQHDENLIKLLAPKKKVKADA